MGMHEHDLVTENGRQVCRFCRQVVNVPILSSDDPRLEGAGLHRSGGNNVEPEFPPLPEMLIALYFNAEFLGLPQAPKAPYIEAIAQEEGRRSNFKHIDPDDIWTNLHREWHAKYQSRQSAAKDDRPRPYTRGRRLHSGR